MAKRTAEPESKLASPKRVLRLITGILVSLLAVLVTVVGVLKAEQFLISDARFAVPAPFEDARRSGNFKVDGVVHAAEERIAQVFARDFGRSLYLCPIAERRRQLLAIDWVEEASVSRIWPDRISVQIKERRPVAFALVSGGETLRPRLVDSNGVLLPSPQGIRLKLPVITGFKSTDAEPSRRERVQRFIRLRDELGPMLDKLSEIDVSNVDNLKVTQQLDGQLLVLMLGSRKFESRLRNFWENYPEIRKRLPYATELDLRLEDRITAVEENAVVE